MIIRMLGRLVFFRLAVSAADTGLINNAAANREDNVEISFIYLVLNL